MPPSAPPPGGGDDTPPPVDRPPPEAPRRRSRIRRAWPVLLLLAWPAWIFSHSNPVVPPREELEEHTGVVTESAELDGGRYNPRVGVRLRVLTDVGVVAGEARGWRPDDPPAVGDTVTFLVTKEGSMRRIWQVTRNGTVVLSYDRARRGALRRGRTARAVGYAALASVLLWTVLAFLMPDEPARKERDE